MEKFAERGTYRTRRLLERVGDDGKGGSDALVSLLHAHHVGVHTIDPLLRQTSELSETLLLLLQLSDDRDELLQHHWKGRCQSGSFQMN